MPAEDFLHVLDTEITPHVNPTEVLIIISGGEPLMRKDLAQVGRALMQRGYPWGMVTNGLALTESRFLELTDAGLRSLTISCDGLEADHVWLRQHPLAFEGATRAIRLIADYNSQSSNRQSSNRPIVWDVVTCANRRNIDHLPAIRDMLWRLGVRDWRVFGIDPMGRAASNPELLLDDNQFRYLMDFIAAEREAGRHVSYSCEGYLGTYEGRVRDHLYQCAAGISVASILIDGSISACTSIRGKYYQGEHPSRFVLGGVGKWLQALPRPLLDAGHRTMQGLQGFLFLRRKRYAPPPRRRLSHALPSATPRTKVETL